MDDSLDGPVFVDDDDGGDLVSLHDPERFDREDVPRHA